MTMKQIDNDHITVLVLNEVSTAWGRCILALPALHQYNAYPSRKYETRPPNAVPISSKENLQARQHYLKGRKSTSPTENPADDIMQEMRHLNVKGTDRKDQDDCKIISEEDKLETPKIKLPLNFAVKYLGCRDATGLWGIKHTRTPVDQMVTEAKQLTKGKTLPFLDIQISEKGVNISEMPTNINKNFVKGFHPIEVISYGVQDLVYTRVFAMIIVREEAKTNHSIHPFQCHAFVCDSRSSARKLTFALAEAFQTFSKLVKNDKSLKPKKFAIDLRSTDEIEADLRQADSEA